MKTHEILDCLIIGAGPAGLVSATYLARFHRRIAVVDAGKSRARWIPSTNNCPGFPFGISGTDLLQKFRTQSTGYGVQIVSGKIESLNRVNGHFEAIDDQSNHYHAQYVLLASGINDVMPKVEGVADALDQAISASAIRLCAVCDGYEASDNNIAVYGPADEAIKHALFLRTFSSNVTAIVSDSSKPSKKYVKQAKDADIPILEESEGLSYDVDTGCWSRCGSGECHYFDTIYPVLGSDSQSQLATSLGAEVDELGELIIDLKQQTTINGLYAIGDVASALNQISVAVGHAAIATTAIHNRLPPNFREVRSTQSKSASTLPSPGD